MTKKIGILQVGTNVSSSIKKTETAKLGTTALSAMEIINRQMKLNGIRKRTIDDYNLNFTQFIEFNELTYLDQITTDTIYNWLDSMNVSDVTKKNRLKCLKAVLSKCLDNGWFEHKFWNTIQIRIDRTIKHGAKENDLNILLSLLDTSTFIGLRDAVAVLTLYRTGVRINTLGQIKENHIDFENKTFNLTGDIMKNHKILKLPLDDQLLELYRILIEQNKQVRKHCKENNDFLFITVNGQTVMGKATSNSIAKQLYKYSKRYNLPNINAHSIRRAYAKGLLDKGASVALISKALGHSSLDVTTQYLDLEVNEVAENLRDYL
ncbi:tyrosine-type recombinase/integrase [Lysinibacillus sp. TE18511]